MQEGRGSRWSGGMKMMTMKEKRKKKWWSGGERGMQYKNSTQPFSDLSEINLRNPLRRKSLLNSWRVLTFYFI